MKGAVVAPDEGELAALLKERGLYLVHFKEGEREEREEGLPWLYQFWQDQEKGPDRVYHSPGHSSFRRHTDSGGTSRSGG